MATYFDSKTEVLRGSDDSHRLLSLFREVPLPHRVRFGVFRPCLRNPYRHPLLPPSPIVLWSTPLLPPPDLPGTLWGVRGTLGEVRYLYPDLSCY